MDLSKYDAYGNIHPDEWIKDLQTYFNIRNIPINIDIAISLVDSIIKLPAGIDNFEKLSNALKEDISFTVFKNENKRMLQSLNFIPENEGGNFLKFISDFRKLCYNAEINNIKEQKIWFYQILLNVNNKTHYNYFKEFVKREEKIKSINDLIKEFEEIVRNEQKLIRNGSIVTLRHVSTGKYLSSVQNLCYTTGSKTQLVYFYIVI